MKKLLDFGGQAMVRNDPFRLGEPTGGCKRCDCQENNPYPAFLMFDSFPLRSLST